MGQRLAVFASGAGTTLEFLLQARREQRLIHDICLLVTNNANAGALAVAKKYNISAAVALTEVEVLNALIEAKIDFIFLAGYLKKIGPQILIDYKGRIFNSHPSLLPKYGGKGMYGSRVTEAVLQAGEKFTGITIHHVNEHYDSGQIMKQIQIPVFANDTLETLESRVKAEEKNLILNFLNSL